MKNKNVKMYNFKKAYHSFCLSIYHVLGSLLIKKRLKHKEPVNQPFIMKLNGRCSIHLCALLRSGELIPTCKSVYR